MEAITLGGNTFLRYRFSPKPLKLQRSSTHNPARRVCLLSIKCCETTNKPSVIQKIYNSLLSKGLIKHEEPTEEPARSGPGTPGAIYLPDPETLIRQRVGRTLEHYGYELPSNSAQTPSENEKNDEWTRAPDDGTCISGTELKRLITLGIRLCHVLKLGKGGVTDGFVHGIHQRWSNSEVVKIRCVDDFYKSNMKRTHRIIEARTGGIIVWRTGSSIVLYRGKDYKRPNTRSTNEDAIDGKRSEYFVEVDNLSNGLDSLSTDMRGSEPLSQDDELPLPGFAYKKPLRLIHHGLFCKLTDSEVTCLRRLSPSLPSQFTLEKTTDLQKLAASVVKLWDTCEIAKIAVYLDADKNDVEEMTEELKLLTGGSLISRDKDFIVLYRGKDFLPSSFAAVLAERKAVLKGMEKNNLENRAELFPLSSSSKQTENRSCIMSPEINHKMDVCMSVEGQEERASDTNILEDCSGSVMVENELTSFVDNDEFCNLLEPSKFSDQSAHGEDTLTDEERFMLTKLGLRMKPFLLLGKRGVFAGIVENMHLHWKYRDLVKIISKERKLENVNTAGKILERESGGILVSVERVSKGYAIIIYRGRQYRRPSELRPRTLLTKKDALKSSIKAQQIESYDRHIFGLRKTVEQLREYHREDGYEKNGGMLDRKLDCSTGTEMDENTIPLKNNKEEGYEKYSGLLDRKLDCSIFPEMDEDTIPFNNTLDFESPAPDHKTNLHLADESETHTKVYKMEKSDVTWMPLPLSNKQRLILRRQALKLKRPVQFHMGKKNVVQGLVDSICEYFKRHPLILVSLKGRDKRTTMTKIASELTERTRSVLVSQETSKIILYRGWLEESNESNESNNGSLEAVSSELLKAIQNECGLDA